MTLQQRINNLRNGESIRIGGNARVWTTAEKSGDGRVIRLVRHTPNNSVVFKVERAAI